MRKVHAAFLRSLELDDAGSMEAVAQTRMSTGRPGGGGLAKSVGGIRGGNSGNRDPEFFLSFDNALRSENGELVRPMVRPPSRVGPFDTLDMAAQTFEFRYWLNTFFPEADDEEGPKSTAKRIVFEICNEQTKRDLRDRGNAGIKGVLSGSEREIYTPLTLVLHELKVWAAEHLRASNAADERTYIMLAQRVKYLTQLRAKDVWWAQGIVLKHGLSGDKLVKLFALLERLVGILNDEKDRCFSRFANRKAHDALGYLVHSTRSSFFNSARLLSCLCGLDGTTFARLAEEGKQIQPADLLDPSPQARVKTDWTNMAHVHLRAMCARNLARAALTGDFSGIDTDTPEALLDFSPAPSFFPKPPPVPPHTAPPPIASAPDLLQDKQGMPTAYVAAVDGINKELRNAPRSALIIRYPLTKDRQFTRWTKAFLNPLDTRTAVLAVCRLLAALEDLAPALVAAHMVWMLSKEGMESPLEHLRPQFVRAAAELSLRVAIVEGAEIQCMRVWTELAAKYLADLGRLDEAAQMLANGPGRARMQAGGKKATPRRPSISYYAVVGGDPVWMQNLDTAARDIVTLNRESYANVYRVARELARDATDFPFAPDIVTHGPKEKVCAQVVDVVSDRLKSTDYRSGFTFLRNQNKLDWLFLGKDLAGPLQDACQCPPESDAARFVAKKEELAMEMAAQIKGASVTLDDQASDVLAGLEEVRESNGGSSTSGPAPAKRSSMSSAKLLEAAGLRTRRFSAGSTGDDKDGDAVELSGGSKPKSGGRKSIFSVLKR